MGGVLICTFEGCEKVRHGRGLCLTHYRQMSRGKTLSPIASRPDPQAWLRAHADHEGDDCLIYSFWRNPNGYGGTRNGAHRDMCEIVHGKPPPPKHHAAHSCGNGKGGCVNPRHLSWKTPKENSADIRVHGNLPLGEKHNSSKLTEEDVMEIRANNSSLSILAAAYSVHKTTIAYVKRNQSWRHI